MALEYDMEQERQFDYSGLNMGQVVEHLAKFVSGIWQIHPFREGNTRTTAVFTTDNENILRLVKAIGHRQLSVKEMLAAVGLKDRMNFMEYSLTPAMAEGFVCLLYPDKPRHPRQKYLLTVKGFALYNELIKDASN